MGQITVFSGPKRRQRWGDDKRLQILTETFSPGACVAEVARRHDVSTALVYTWRRKVREAQAGPIPDGRPGEDFVEAVVIEDEGGCRPSVYPALNVDLARGRRVSVFASASPAQVAAALKALRWSSSSSLRTHSAATCGPSVADPGRWRRSSGTMVWGCRCMLSGS